MELSDLLRYTTVAIAGMGLRYFVTGSTATVFSGEPRFTNDIGVVVDLPEGRVAECCRQFPQDQLYVSIEAAQDAVRTKSQFNMIHPASGLKVDVIVPESSAFNQSRFDRARVVQPESSVDAWFASPEDAIIKKMQYYREGRSEKHLRDITGVLKVRRGQIDLPYIQKWARQLDLDEIWAAVQQRVVS